MSVILTLLQQRSGGEVALLTFVAYLLFYTMYDKLSKKLVPAKLLGVLLFEEGISKSLIELNKIVGLAGLSLLCTSFFPIFQRNKYVLLWYAMVMLWLHAVYSLYQYFDLILGNKRWKQISLVLGVCDQVVISAGYFEYLESRTFSLVGIILGVAHFYFMEIDHKFILRVRPFAYIVFLLASAALIFNF